ncbi:Poly (ADP-ribose) polymerase [Desmophyllum pertusum]|uniref:Poly (ADP-ribose) polymerase n=1 Tax=Desmophyllum pertusum TaxID=174260 RepID=A0A9W9YHY7_9CNID|nr:Poly (ADP-ribose) polymerase [Desmophyllum pertusum]
MAEDVLVAKLFNYICGSGGFVELAVLLKPSSPLGSRKTKLEAKKWLRTQGPQSGFVCVTDQNDEITGVRVDLRSKICQQYVVKGFCRRANTGNCKYWHICKSYIEGNCDGTCGLSHNFFSEDNQWKAEELGLEKHSNGTVRNIVAWSLPQVCQLYLINKCKSDKCPYLHICSKMVQGSSCKSCDLSHSLTDSHNNKIIKQYDLVPSHQVINVDFVRCSILVLNDQKCIGGCGTVVTDKTTSVVANNGKQNASVLANTATAVVTKPARKQDPPATLSSVASPGKRQDNTDNGQIAKVLFECLCKEFKCSAPLTLLKNRTDVNVKELKDVSLFLEENKDRFLSTRNENGNIQDIIAFCPKLRLCFDFLFLNECQKEHCPFFHLCRKFITGSCRHGGKCSRSHNFRNKRDQETVLKLDLDLLTNEQLRQLMLSSSPRVCISYNKGKCTNDSRCPRLHICKDFVVNACKNGDSCRFQHKWAFDTHHTRSLLEKYRLGKMSQDNVWKNYFSV